jgi:hypothetical protein
MASSIGTIGRARQSTPAPLALVIAGGAERLHHTAPATALGRARPADGAKRRTGRRGKPDTAVNRARKLTARLEP